MNARMTAAIAGIVIVVAVVYVFSIIPYIVNSGGRTFGSTVPAIEILIPAAVAPLVLILVFLVPSRRSDERVLVSESGNEGEARREMPRPPSLDELAAARFRKHSAISGLIAGFAAASILAALIFVGDALMGLPVGAFYEIIALAMTGVTQPSVAISLGVALHLMSGTIIGGAFGFLTASVEPFNIDSIRKGIGVGVLAGFVSFSLLFIPITRFQVEPALTGILLNSGIIPSSTNPSDVQSQITDFMSSVIAFSIVFHLMYGAIMGGLTAILVEKLPLGKTSIAANEPHSSIRKGPDFSEAS